MNNRSNSRNRSSPHDRHRDKKEDRNYSREYRDDIPKKSSSRTSHSNTKYSDNKEEKRLGDNDKTDRSKLKVVTDEIKKDEEDELIDIQEIEEFMNNEIDPEEEEKRIFQERKRRREEILAKYKNEKTDMPSNEDNHNSFNKKTNRSDVDEEFIELTNEKSAVEAESNTKYNTTFDIFSSTPSDLEKYQHLKDKAVSKNSLILKESLVDEGEDRHLQSNWDDVEGYYKCRIGELIQERYRTLGIVGKGVFSTVLKCVDLKKPIENSADLVISSESKYEAVAIKVIRNNDTMRKAAEKELQILTLLTKHDPQNKKHCVPLIDKFEYRSHIAFVFEFQSMNLRETLKKFGANVGINIGAIKLYYRQLLIALKYLADLRIVHADIKLDNILCSADLKSVKVCDFGSAFFETDQDNIPTPYLVSRFYRAPEIILGQAYDRQIDLWSVAVSAYELFTGHVMFPGRSNNEMLKLMMSIKGRFPNKLIKSHLRQFDTMGIEPHFDNDMRFKQYEIDKISGKNIMRLVEITQPTKDLSSILRSSKAGADDSSLVSSFTNLLDLCLALDPTKRISVNEALKHSFFNNN